MRLRITHTTHYAFGRPVSHGLQRLRLSPKTTQGQKVLDWRMRYEGAVEEARFEDHNSNHVVLVSVQAGVSEVMVVCEGLVATANNHGMIGQHAGHMPMWTFLTQSGLTRPGPKVRAIMSQIDLPRDEPVPVLHQLSGLIREAIDYVPGQTSVLTTAEEAALLGVGVCQDHAHVFIGAARALGMPARYVSGYLMMDDRIDQEAGHAWAEVHVAGLGWVGFDVANGISPDERYVRVATGRDYGEAAPVTGLSWGAGETRLAVTLAVEQQIQEQ
jgi:transglutaminase-like putative cysteine protease